MSTRNRAQQRRKRPAEAFLSFADGDRVFARRLARGLLQRGIKVWFAPSHLRGGDQWHDEIGQALARCDWLLVVLSPSSTGSFWVKMEVKYALSERKYRGKIVPILLRRCDPKRLSWTLPAIQHISFCDRRFGDAFEDLLAIWDL